MKLFPTLLFSLIIIINACSPSQETINKKFDAPLFDILNKYRLDGNENLISFLGKCEVEPSYEMKKEIDYTGINVERFAGKSFKAFGTAEQIQRVAQLSFIYSLELTN